MAKHRILAGPLVNLTEEQAVNEVAASSNAVRPSISDAVGESDSLVATSKFKLCRCFGLAALDPTMRAVPLRRWLEALADD